MRFRKGKIVAVTFDDHMQGGSEPMRFFVYGRVGEIKRGWVCIDSWAHIKANQPYDPINEQRFTILRKTIVRAVELVEKTV